MIFKTEKDGLSYTGIPKLKIVADLTELEKQTKQAIDKLIKGANNRWQKHIPKYCQEKLQYVKHSNSPHKKVVSSLVAPRKHFCYFIINNGVLFFEISKSNYI